MARARAAALAVLLLGGCATPLPRAPLPRADAPGTPPCGPQQYPFQALQDFVQGQVIVVARVGADGGIEDAQVVRTAGHPYLDAAAVEGARHCRLVAFPAGAQVPLLFTYQFWGRQEYLPIGVVTVDYAPLPGK
ncbi:TonB family protein [Ramlibacter ginsenosidimutans]|uniref:TonB family protein n=1 Tax=Ramlibacter ginsenosidimutans TaxID=502333 RepID=A0A934U0L4_9BURK|nr:TonB family protein [Ramlibacter ginsenosidimutans]MBK6009250.1 TonB family protein [Ramlibacter ginsenosidimutans]